MKDRMKLGALLGLLAACAGGTISNGDGKDAKTGGANGQPFGTVTPVQLEQETRLVRLSHEQYANTLSDLFGDSDSRDLSFAPDSLNGFKFDTSNDLRVDARSGPEYRASAEEIAARAANDASVFGRIVSCDTSDAACPNQFIQSFGERAFRHPLSDAELSRFRTLFDQGSELGNGGDPFHEGVQLVVEAMLQSPQFLYRAVLSQGQVKSGRSSIDD